MRRAVTASFRRLSSDDGATSGSSPDTRIVFEIRPVPPSWSFLAAAILLGGLFGAPALAVILDLNRRDAWSLGSAVCGLLILGLAVRAGWQAVTGRGRQRISLTAAGIETPAGLHHWPEVAGLEVQHPRRSRFTPGPSSGGTTMGEAVVGSHRLGAAIAQQQQAGDTRIALHRHGHDAPVTLVAGLDEATAERLRDALLAAAATFGTGSLSRPAPGAVSGTDC